MAENNRSARGRGARRRVAGAGTAVGAFLAFGLSPLAAAPPAQAEDFGWFTDLFGWDSGDA
ncbi:hypothetical protein, partial [Mycolicibacter icosiumassiliensis]|uniref:hypothetical protein n=1 Tax=Mycolicibacter icosiumassiliensis TaxID=1792835 RepID=UPI000A8BB6DB